MNDPPAWDLVRQKTVHDCRIFRLDETDMRSPRNGEVHTFYRIEAPDWTNVVPVTKDGRIVMVRQFRLGSQDTTLEVPGGMVDPDEEPAVAAARELLEETGYQGDELELIGVVNPNPALFGNRLHTYVAPGVVPVAPIRNEGKEETVVSLVSEDDLPRLVREGAISHALVLVAFHWYGLWSA